MKAEIIDVRMPQEPVPVQDLARRLAHDGLAMARAEMELATARAAPKIRLAEVGLALILGGAVIAMLAAFGLIVGLVLALAALVGPAFAGLIVGGSGIALGGITALFGARLLSHLLKSLMEKLG